MKTNRLKQAFSTLAFLLVLALGSVKVFVLPAMFVYLAAYFLLAGAWKDATFVPYMQLFLTTVGPVVWAGGTACLFAKFHRVTDRGPEGSVVQ